MRAIGLADVELAELLPTVLPADELCADTVWRMVDGRIFHLEFQTQREPTLYRFLGYDTRLAERYHSPVRTVVLYHRDVTEAPASIDLAGIHYQIENVCLTQLDGEAALEIVAQHLAGHTWEPSDCLRLALALCMHSEERRAFFGQTLALLPQVPSPERDLVTAAIMALAESRLTNDELDQWTKELTKMSKILDRVEEKSLHKGLEQGRQEGWQEAQRVMAQALLADGDPIGKVMTITGLTRPAVEAWRAQ